jgi:hypothetical protein
MNFFKYARSDFKIHQNPPRRIGGAHHQTSEQAAPPVSVEEKGKTTGEKRKMLLLLLMSIQNQNLTVFMLLGGPQNMVFTALFCFAPLSVFSSRMSAPYWSNPPETRQKLG